jgi:MYXO-CTERM domain-containing protein
MRPPRGARATAAPLLAASLALLLGPLPAPGRALAYVVNRTSSSSTVIRWKESNTIYLTLNSKGSSDIVDGRDLLAAKRSLDNWRTAVQGCSYIRFAVESESPRAIPKVDGETKENAPDEKNVIVWQENDWHYGSHAAALTTVFFIDTAGSALDGRIIDADLELNGVDFCFTTTGRATCFDVENTITHEIGHLLGLDHPCDDGARSPVPVDQDGRTIPSCTSSQLPAWIKETTMYNFANYDETKKQTPEEDDVAGICELYPTAEDPGVATPVNLDEQDVGCSISGGGPDPGTTLLFVLIAAFAAVRRLRHA